MRLGDSSDESGITYRRYKNLEKAKRVNMLLVDHKLWQLWNRSKKALSGTFDLSNITLVLK